MPDSDGRRDDAELLFDCVREAGALALTLRRQEVRHWAKADGSQVTDADFKIDALLTGRLQRARPGYGWLSEETPDGSDRLTRQRLWIVDPIDGTQDFIHRGIDWCIAAALIDSGRPVVAAVYRPMRHEFFSAIAGEGAFLDSTRLTITGSETLAEARIAGNRKSLAALKGHGIASDVTHGLPLQLRLCYIAAGRLDGALSTGNRNDWDLAAGDLIVHEAGGLVSDVSGAQYVYNRPQPWQHGLVAAGAKRHARLIHALRTP